MVWCGSKSQPGRRRSSIGVGRFCIRESRQHTRSDIAVAPRRLASGRVVTCTGDAHPLLMWTCTGTHMNSNFYFTEAIPRNGAIFLCVSVSIDLSSYAPVALPWIIKSIFFKKLFFFLQTLLSVLLTCKLPRRNDIHGSLEKKISVFLRCFENSLFKSIIFFLA